MNFNGLAESFNNSFTQTFARSQESAIKKQEQEAIAKQQADADAKLLESFQGVEAQDQDRMAGVQALSDLRTTGNLSPAARKAMTKGKLAELESQGVIPSPEFTDWYSTAKPDELNAVMDIIFEESQKDPEFGQQKLIDTISNPEAFRTILSQAGTEANAVLQETPETAQTSSKSQAMLKNISSEMTKTQAEINRLQTQRNKLVEATALNSGASDAARKAIEMRANQIDDRIKQAQSRITELDRRAYDLEKEGKRTLRKFVTGQGEQNIYEMEDGSFTDIQGQPIDVSQGMVTTIGSRPGQMTSITTNPDGTVSFEQGEAGDLTKSQAGQEKIKWDDKVIAATNFVQSSNKIADGVIENPSKLGVTGLIGRVAGEVKGIVSNLKGLGVDTSSVSQSVDDYDFGTLGAESAGFKTDMLNLALLFAGASGLGTGRELTNADVQRAVDAIGASTNDPSQLVARIASAQDSLVNNLKTTAKVKKFEFGGIDEYDPTRFKAKEPATTDEVPEGANPEIWKIMTPEMRQQWIDAGG